MQLIPSDSGVYSMINYDMDKKDNISPRVFQKVTHDKCTLGYIIVHKFFLILFT